MIGKCRIKRSSTGSGNGVEDLFVYRSPEGPNGVEVDDYMKLREKGNGDDF